MCCVRFELQLCFGELWIPLFVKTPKKYTNIFCFKGLPGSSLLT